ncbi:MAG: HD domain-containing protein [Candidatus Nitrosotenuis sp.]
MKATRESSNLKLFEFIIRLKTIPRTGWQKKLGMVHTESIADHAYSVAAIAMFLSDAKKLDSEKTIKMAILHDLAESITGDLTPDDVTKSKKIKLENIAMKKILSSLDAKTRKQYWSLWIEYQKNISKEAKLLHQVDKLEMALQANAYKKSGYSKQKLWQFFDSAKKQISDYDIKKILTQLD